MLSNWLAEGYYFYHNNLFDVDCPMIDNRNTVIGKIIGKQIVENNQALYTVKFTKPINFFEMVMNGVNINQVYFLNKA